MDSYITALSLLGAAAAAVSLGRLKGRIALSRAKHPSLAGHARISRRLAALIPFYEYDEKTFFCSDLASDEIAERRRQGFMRLAARYREMFCQTADLTAQVHGIIPDLRFIDTYRVPFQFSRFVKRHFNHGIFLQASQGVTVTDLDGNRLYDLSGSYGVNLFGYDFYKRCIEDGQKRVRDLGPVLGAYHPVVADNVKRLRAISGLDDVSFHMSGTEAVMQAVLLARYHTKRSHLVRFCGAYHGWWGDVQPGVGNPSRAPETYTLAEMSERTLRVLSSRKNIACVLVNPLQALHPNATAPSDGALVDSSWTARFDREAYTKWLRELRAICTRRNIVLIFDEVFVGFRLAQGGAQEYFGVKADLVTYGKTLGGGLPVGVLCGRSDLMKRYRDDRPGDFCFARGTFNSHPYVMGAMHEFLRHLETTEAKQVYADLDRTWEHRAHLLNQRLIDEGLPVRVINISTIWTVIFTNVSRYNWMLQFYLRAEGLALSWVGTGRFIFSLNYSDADFSAVTERFVAAARSMADDGWWSAPPNLTNKSVRRGILREVLNRKISTVMAWNGDTTAIDR